MAKNCYAQSNINYSGTWYDQASGGGNVVTPEDGDTLCMQGWTITMDVARVPASGTLAAVTNSASSSGFFLVPLNSLGAESHIYATTMQGSNNASKQLFSITGDNNTIHFHGDVYGTSETSVGGGYGLRVTATTNANVIVTGSVTGYGGHAIYSTAGAAITIHGNVNGSSQIANQCGIYINTTGASGGLTIDNGNVTAGNKSASHGVRNGTSTNITITGSVIGSTSAGNGVYNSSSGNVTITGDIVGGTTGAYALYNAGASSTTTINNSTITGGDTYVAVRTAKKIVLNNVNLKNVACYAVYSPGITWNFTPFNYEQFGADGGANTQIYYPSRGQASTMDVAGAVGSAAIYGAF